MVVYPFHNESPKTMTKKGDWKFLHIVSLCPPSKSIWLTREEF